MSGAEVARQVRRGVGLFDMAHRGLLEVRGGDRVRWLDGMISGDAQALEDAESGSGCYAMLLTNRGAIVADLHVARLGETFLLESLRSEIPRIKETLEKFIIADDVELVDRSEDFDALGLEGPRAGLVLDRFLAGAAIRPEANCWREVELEGHALLVAAFGWSGEDAYQLRISRDAENAREAIEALLVAAAGGGGLVRGDHDSLEILRVEAGIPALGAELDEEVLPPEARLERAIATDKGCYVGQEIVARLRARGQVNHLLVGLRLEGSIALPAPETELLVEGRKTGEITSVAESPSVGPIALGYVRREHAEAGTRIEFEGGAAIVADLPFVAPAETP